MRFYPGDKALCVHDSQKCYWEFDGQIWRAYTAEHKYITNSPNPKLLEELIDTSPGLKYVPMNRFITQVLRRWTQ